MEFRFRYVGFVFVLFSAIFSSGTATQAQNRSDDLKAAVEIVSNSAPGEDLTNAIDQLYLAVDSGNRNAMLLLAQLYYEGEKVEQNKELAVNLLREAAVLNSPKAVKLLTDIYISEEDYDEALNLLNSLSAEGNSSATLSLVQFYMDKKIEFYSPEKANSYLDVLIEPTGGLTEASGAVQGLAARIYTERLKVSTIHEEQIQYIKKLEELAKADVWSALRTLASIYIKGDSGVEADPVRGFAYVSRGVDLENVSAYLLLGNAYLTGKDITQDTQRGISLIERAAKRENQTAIMKLAELSLDGLYDGYSLDKAQVILTQAAEQSGSVAAALKLSKAFAAGTFGEVDQKSALKYSKLVADLGSAAGLKLYDSQLLEFGDSLQVLGVIAKLEEAVLDGDLAAARKLIRIYSDGEKTASNANKVKTYVNLLASDGDSSSRLYLAGLFLKGDIIEQDIVRGVGYITQAFDDGEPSAIIPYANVLLSGEFVDEDIPLAVEILTKASESGNDKALLRLASLYLQKDQPYSDFEKGFAILENSLDQSPNANNAFKVGNAYLRGAGVERDVEKGLRYMKQAAEGGNMRANSILGALYQVGKDVPKNFRLAQSYFEQAVLAGDENAELKLGDIFLATRQNDRAIETYKNIAANGNPLGDVRIATAYLSKARFPGKFDEGISKLKELSNQEIPEASKILAGLYLKGRPELPQDNSQALFYYDAAINSGDVRAAGERLILISQINDSLENRENIGVLYSELDEAAQRVFLQRGFRTIEGQVAYLVQQKLKALGFYNGPLDGLFGRGSAAAVRSFCLDDATNGPCDTPEWSARNAIRVMQYQTNS